jgi:hypothetical protein
MGGGDGEELAVAGCCGRAVGTGDEAVAVAVGGKQRRRDQDHRVVAGARRRDDCRDRLGVTDHELMEELLREWWRHAVSVDGGADAALTAR